VRSVLFVTAASRRLALADFVFTSAPGSLSPGSIRTRRRWHSSSSAQSGRSDKNIFRSALSRLEAERRLAELGAKWSQVSGYDAIEALKRSVLELETRLKTARVDLDNAKSAYVDAVNLRSHSQRAINDLLSRKSAWSEDDLSAYTSLLRSEHSQTRAETESQSRYERAERDVQAAFDDLIRAVMRRYHEEQVWSDKVRNASSYATLIVAGLNVLIFTIAVIFVEPYKRKKLAQTFEKRLLEGEAHGRALIQDTIDEFEKRNTQAQQALIAEIEEGHDRIVASLGVSSSHTRLNRESGVALPLAARLRVGLADEGKRAEWAVTSGLGALAGIACTLAWSLLAGRPPPGGPGSA